MKHNAIITENIQLAIDELLNNNVIGLPTETVYGLAANAFSHSSIRKIFQLKNRPLNNPLIVHIPSVDHLEKIATEIPENARLLAEKFWPGPLTLLLKKHASIPDLVTANKPTVAVRVPNHPVALELLNSIDFPLVAPSANPYTTISPTQSSHVLNYFDQNLNVILEGGKCEKGIESTIVGFSEGSAIIYRLGAISVEQIEEVLGEVEVRNETTHEILAPGMAVKHYSPKTTLILSENIQESIDANQHKKIGFLFFTKRNEHMDTKNMALEFLSEKGDYAEASQNLYAKLHMLDAMDLDLIIVEKLPNISLGRSINDRLTRASKK